jgi:hypothetical protein
MSHSTDKNTCEKLQFWSRKESFSAYSAICRSKPRLQYIMDLNFTLMEQDVKIRQFQVKKMIAVILRCIQCFASKKKLYVTSVTGLKFTNASSSIVLAVQTTGNTT